MIPFFDKGKMMEEADRKLDRKLIDEIKDLKKTLFLTGIQVEEMLQLSFDALEKNHGNKRDQVIKKYTKIINLQIEIENRALELISHYKPDETTLRELIAIMKIVFHLERIAVRCGYIARTDISIPFKELKQDLLQLKNMVYTSIEMFLIVLDSFKHENAKRNDKISTQKNQIDNFYHRFNIRVVAEIQKNPKDTEEYLKLVYLNRDIERLTEHLTSICEWI